MITPEKYPRHLQKMFIVILLFIFPSCRNSESRYQHSATTGVTLLTAKSFLVNSNVRHNFSGVATHSTILVLRNDNSILLVPMKSNIFQAFWVFQASSWAGLHSTILFTPGPGPASARVWGEVTSQGAGQHSSRGTFRAAPAAASWGRAVGFNLLNSR